MKRNIESDQIELIIPEMDANIIRKVLSLIQDIPPLSAVDFLSELKSKGMESPLFKAARLFLGLAEGVKSQTYPIEFHETIGIGLDLTSQKADGVALFYAMDPKRDWKTLYPQMQKHDNLPNPPLSPTDIDRLLYYTLIGADYEQYHVQGRIEALISDLKHHNENIDASEIKFEAHQLLALQSMSYNTDRLIGPKLITALKLLDQTGDDSAVLEQILEYSNRGKLIGIENRRLMEAGLFHGDPSPDQIHVYWRLWPVPGPLMETSNSAEKARALTSERTVVPPHYPYALPSGVHHLDFKGGDKVITVPGPDSEGLDVTVFGSKNGDYLQVMNQNASPVLLGGDGDDVLELSIFANYYPVYMAGNTGFDTYKINIENIQPSSDGLIIVHDSDRKGKIIFSGITIEGTIINETLMLGGGKSIGGIHRYKNPDGSYWVIIGPISIPNYVSGQFGLVWTEERGCGFDLYPKHDTYDRQAIGILSNGNILNAYLADCAEAYCIYKDVYDCSNKLISREIVARNFGIRDIYGVLPKTKSVYYSTEAGIVYIDGRVLTSCPDDGIRYQVQSDFSLKFYCSEVQYGKPDYDTPYTVILNSPKGYGLILTQLSQQRGVSAQYLDWNQKVFHEETYARTRLVPSAVLSNGDIASMLVIDNGPGIRDSSSYTRWDLSEVPTTGLLLNPNNSLPVPSNTSFPQQSQNNTAFSALFIVGCVAGFFSLLALTLFFTAFAFALLSNKRFKHSLENHSDLENTTTQVNYNATSLKLVARQIYRNIKISGFLWYISQNDMDAYVRAVDAILQKINLTLFTDTEELTREETLRLANEISSAIKELLIPTLRSCFSPLSIFAPQITPQSILEKAEKIAELVNDRQPLFQRGNEPYHILQCHSRF